MPDTIIASTTPQFTVNSRIICRVCEKQFTQYTSPRCNILYCSLQCYKSHNPRCTASLMKENVVQELQQLQPDEARKKKMLDILKRFHEEAETSGMASNGVLIIASLFLAVIYTVKLSSYDCGPRLPKYNRKLQTLFSEGYC